MRNQAEGIVAVDLLTQPTVRSEVLSVFVMLALERRRLAFANVTTNPTAFWLGQQVVDALSMGDRSQVPVPGSRGPRCGREDASTI